MDQFNKDIMMGAENKQFHFKKLTNVEGEKFFITTIDEKKKPISFSMKIDKHGDWNLTPGSLRWLYDIRKDLAAAILETRINKS